MLLRLAHTKFRTWELNRELTGRENEANNADGSCRWPLFSRLSSTPLVRFLCFPFD